MRAWRVALSLRGSIDSCVLFTEVSGYWLREGSLRYPLLPHPAMLACGVVLTATVNLTVFWTLVVIRIFYRQWQVIVTATAMDQ